jgi:hypothetical protein
MTSIINKPVPKLRKAPEPPLSHPERLLTQIVPRGRPSPTPPPPVKN